MDPIGFSAFNAGYMPSCIRWLLYQFMVEKKQQVKTLTRCCGKTVLKTILT